MGFHLFPPLIFADAALSGRAGKHQLFIVTPQKTGVHKDVLCPPRARQTAFFESDFGTTDILAAVDHDCISPVRD
jgi:hypothetical protein